MYRHFFKRFLDIFISLLAFPFFLLILLIIAPFIYFEDKGSVFYNAPRLGKNGKIFKMYKFRSMIMKAPDIRNNDGSTYNNKQDPRLTKIGRLIRASSIDETPQLINILKGDMSFIGPRPDLPEAINIYTTEESKKLTVRPGITGYNQAYFRNSVESKIKFENDVYYVNNLNFILDIKIIIRTFISVISKKNIYIENTDINIDIEKKELIKK